MLGPWALPLLGADLHRVKLSRNGVINEAEPWVMNIRRLRGLLYGDIEQECRYHGKLFGSYQSSWGVDSNRPIGNWQNLTTTNSEARLFVWSV